MAAFIILTCMIPIKKTCCLHYFTETDRELHHMVQRQLDTAAQSYKHGCFEHKFNLTEQMTYSNSKCEIRSQSPLLSVS